MVEFFRIRMESKINSQVNCQQLVGIMMCGDYFWTRKMLLLTNQKLWDPREAFEKESLYFRELISESSLKNTSKSMQRHLSITSLLSCPSGASRHLGPGTWREKQTYSLSFSAPGWLWASLGHSPLSCVHWASLGHSPYLCALDSTFCDPT